MKAIEVRDVHKVYRRYGRRRQFSTLKSALLSGRIFGGLRPDATFEALRGVSFDVEAGTTFGIVGRNGSGKSTMLKMIAGIGRPTGGSVTVRGRVSALIELGAGFHPEISGRENIFINGMMLGLTRGEVAKRFDEIVAFSGIEDFIEAPVKTYSSGMYTRLGFAVAIHVDPEVLLVDEVLAVGDEAFAHKCFDKLSELKRRGRTVLLVTHALDLVTRFCDEALWLDAGQARAAGDPRRVIDAYLLDVARSENEALAAGTGDGRPSGQTFAGSVDGETAPADMYAAAEGRWGSREVNIVSCELSSPSGAPTRVFASGDGMEIRLGIDAPSPVRDFVFGVGIFNADGVCCYGTNTLAEGAVPEEIVGSGEVVFAIDRLDLVEGTYKLDVAVHRENGVPYDYHRLLYTFKVTSRIKDSGVFRPPHRWVFSGGVRISGL